MFKCSVIGFIVLFCFYFIDISCEQVDVPVDLKCMSCLCNAASGCDTETKCVEGSCGAYRITRDYWIDGGTPTYNKMSILEDSTFEKCATNFFCSLFTIQGYMERYKRDCNGDGKIDCEDFAAIHVLGADNCNSELPEDFKFVFDQCK